MPRSIMSRRSASTRSTRTRRRWSARRARRLAEINSVRLFGPDDSAGDRQLRGRGGASARCRHHLGRRPGRDPRRPSLRAAADGGSRRPATARASFGVYNGPDDVEALVRGYRTGDEDLRMNERAQDRGRGSRRGRAAAQGARRATMRSRDVRAQARLSRRLPGAKPAADGARRAGRRALRGGDRGAEGHLRPRNPGQHLRSRPDLRCRGHRRTACRGDDDADHAALPGRRIDAGRGRAARRRGARHRLAEVNLVWDPPWDPEKMSDEARLELGML